LAENAHFAEVCRSCNIEFIGPPHEAMLRLGDKVEARRLAKQARVHTVPGSDGPLEHDGEALRLAQEMGYPVLIKAAAGGGGRGMRVARNDISLQTGLAAARSEAAAAFKDARVYLEKYIERPRHVEVQILADSQGEVVHLWERECSLQRRHQKLVEESPAPNLPAAVREDICKAAVRLAKAAGYVNAGTVEFLVDQGGQFYFIEANARIQVEHPVTEMVTGIDLVKQQIRIAAGEPLGLTQRQVTQTGSAIECRINAEDPTRGFKPSPGTISRLLIPGGFGVRFDSHVHQGYRVGPHYDSLIGKLIVHRPTRPEAIACMVRALEELCVEGVPTTTSLHKEIFRHSNFVDGQVDTTFIERTWQWVG
jgi:acetyl-CoA carboxylase biotin carboxylase subunit